MSEHVCHYHRCYAEWDEHYEPCPAPPFPDGCRLNIVRPGKVQCDCDGQGEPCLDCGLPMFDDWFLRETGRDSEGCAAHPPVHMYGAERRCGTNLSTGEFDPWGHRR